MVCAQQEIVSAVSCENEKKKIVSTALVALVELCRRWECNDRYSPVGRNPERDVFLCAVIRIAAGIGMKALLVLGSTVY